MYLPCLDTSVTATIYLNSHQNLINGAQIELLYDPQILHNVNLTPAPNNFFGKDYTVLLEEVREEFGRATFAIEENPGRTPKQGNSPVALLSFQAVSENPVQTTTISFLNKSTATNNMVETSLLKSTQALTIICKP